MKLPVLVTASDGKKYFATFARPLHAESLRLLRVEDAHRPDPDHANHPRRIAWPRPSGFEARPADA